MLEQSYLSLSCWDPKTSEHLNLEKKLPVISFSEEFKIHSCGWGHILGQRGSFPCVDSAFGLVTLHIKPWSHQIKECVITVSSLHSFAWRLLLSWYICHIACQSLLQPASFLLACLLLSTSVHPGSDCVNPPQIPPVGLWVQWKLSNLCLVKN